MKWKSFKSGEPLDNNYDNQTFETRPPITNSSNRKRNVRWLYFNRNGAAPPAIPQSTITVR
jgi:hypothetical protein